MSSADVRTVLVVEDNPDHALLMRIAVERVAPHVNVRIVGDGVEAISYLEGVGPYADRWANPFPALVLLDLIMPRLNGFGFLSWVRSRKETKGLPIVVLTSSLNPTDEARARDLGASDYQSKPSDLVRLGEQVLAILARWPA